MKRRNFIQAAGMGIAGFFAGLFGAKAVEKPKYIVGVDLAKGKDYSNVVIVDSHPIPGWGGREIPIPRGMIKAWAKHEDWDISETELDQLWNKWQGQGHRGFVKLFNKSLSEAKQRGK